MRTLRTQIAENALLLDAQEAYSLLLRDADYYFIAINGKIEGLRVRYDKPCPVIGEDYYALACTASGVYLCVSGDRLESCQRLLGFKIVDKNFQVSGDNEVIPAVGELVRQGAGCKDDSAGSVSVAGDAADGRNADDGAPIEDISNED